MGWISESGGLPLVRVEEKYVVNAFVMSTGDSMHKMLKVKLGAADHLDCKRAFKMQKFF